MRYAFLVPTLAAAALLLASCSDAEEELPQDAAQAVPSATATTPTALVEGQLWRWLNVTVFVPEGSKVVVVRGTIPPQMRGAGGPGLELIVNHDDGSVSNMGIDATTGETVFDTVAAEDRAVIDEVLKTLAVTPFDEAAKGWPYQEVPAPDVEQHGWYVIPDPASGVQISSGRGDPGGPFIDVSNGRSTIQITYDAQAGAVSRQSGSVSPLDEAAFDRYFSSIQSCAKDARC